MSLTNTINKKNDEKKVENPDQCDKNVKLNEEKSVQKRMHQREKMINQMKLIYVNYHFQEH